MSFDRDQLWQSNWVWNALWHIQYLLVLLVIAFLWRPTANNARWIWWNEIIIVCFNILVCPGMLVLIVQRSFWKKGRWLCSPWTAIGYRYQLVSATAGFTWWNRCWGLATLLSARRMTTNGARRRDQWICMYIRFLCCCLTLGFSLFCLVLSQSPLAIQCRSLIKTNRTISNLPSWNNFLSSTLSLCNNMLVSPCGNSRKLGKCGLILCHTMMNLTMFKIPCAHGIKKPRILLLRLYA